MARFTGLTLDQSCQPPTSSNIENWWGVRDRWRHNAGHMTSFWGEKTREKDVVLIVTFDLIGLLPTNHKLLLILQWRTGVWEETFTVNRKIAQTTKNVWNFIVRESNLQEMANFGDHPGDLNLWSGDREKRFKIWSLPDYPGELTAL